MIAPLLISLLMALPLLTIMILALTATGDSSNSFRAGQLWQLALTTGLLCVGTAVLALVIGTASAWLVAAYDFPGRRLLSWMAILPLAMPGYIIAFVTVEFLDYAGPVQTWMRGAMGWSTPQDYVFPPIRSIGGAALTFALVLYPYVYLAGRAAFARMPASQIMVARTLGRNPLSTFFSVVLPQARPALAVGAALVIMECLNDIGSVSFFGVRTFATAIYSTWLDQGNLRGAAQLSLLMIAVIAILVYGEQRARKRDRLSKTPAMSQQLRRTPLSGARAVLALLTVALPILLGFVIPVVLLVMHGFRRYDEAASSAFLEALFHTIVLGAAAALLTILIALALNPGKVKLTHGLPRFMANMGYAIPGTILAIGVIVPMSRLDHGLNAVTQNFWSWLPGLVFSGTVFALLFAYTTRFLVIASGMVEAGCEKIPISLSQAARTLGRRPFRVFTDVRLPLLRPALVAGALLVFVDAMKELPATLLLRPFDYETLATLTFASASLGQIEQAALPALAIVAAGLIPIYILMRSLNDHTH